MPSRWQNIVTAVDTQMKTILTTNGYQTNLGQHVVVWRAAPIEEGETSFLNIRDLWEVKADDVIKGSNNLDNWFLVFELEIVAAPGSTTPETVRKGVADVHKAIGAAAATKWGITGTNGAGLVETYLGVPEGLQPAVKINVEHAERKISGAAIYFFVHYRNIRYQEN